MKNLYLFLALLFIAFSCSEKTAKTEFVDPILPVWLDFDVTEIVLEDFVNNCDSVDSVTVEGRKLDFYQSNKSVTYKRQRDDKPLNVMKIWQNGISTDILLKRSLKQYIMFQFDPQGKKYKEVQVKGEFNGWNPSQTKLALEDGVWRGFILLNKGKYQYKIVVDGEEILDPACSTKVDNNIGGFNSLMEVGNDDYTKAPQLITESFDDKHIIINTLNEPDQVIAFFNNQTLEQAKVENGHLKIQIPTNSNKFGRSYIRVYASNKFGLANDIMIPLANGKVIDKPELLQRTDLQSNILYNVFVDRFYNADPKNDNPLPDSVVLPAANYNGGDMKGVIEKINDGYFKELGVNSLWLSPVVKNVEGAYGYWPKPETKFSAYHGYWPTSFTQINPHFGDSTDLLNLVEIAHESGFNILLDFVANHVHEEHPYYKSNPKIATDLVLPDGRLNLELWDEQRLTTWFDKFLPTLDLENIKTTEMLVDSTVRWVQKYGIDGFRYDAAKHIPTIFWRTLTRQLKDSIVNLQGRHIYQLGETYGGVELINSYVSTGLLDAQFDFNVYDAAVNVFASKGSFARLMDRLRESLTYYGSHNTMGYITGNQDRARFISYAGGSLRFDENAKEAGWTREITVGDPVSYKKLALLMAFNMTIPGIPVIYYGDEFGMPGGNDPDSRRMMRFGDKLNDLEKNNLALTKKLISLRKSNLALIYGDFVNIGTTDSLLIFSRKYFENEVIVILNNSSIEMVVDIDKFAGSKKFTTNFDGVLSRDGVKSQVVIKPNSFEILTTK